MVQENTQSPEEKELILIERSFEAFYEMGHDRSLTALSSETGIPFDQLKEWSEFHAWSEKVKARTDDLDRSFDAHYRAKTKDIRNRLVNQMENLIGDMEASSLGLPFTVSNISDFRALSQAYESLVRANTLALQHATDLHNDEAPTTWADLLASEEKQIVTDEVKAGSSL